MALKVESVELDEITPIVRSYKTNNGINRKRYRSVGEDKVCVKRQRTTKWIVCFK